MEKSEQYKDYIEKRVVDQERLSALENSLDEKIPRDLLSQSIIEHNAEEFMRHYYCKELQSNMTNLSSCKHENFDGVDVIKFDGNKFAMLVSALGAYSHDLKVDFKPQKDGSKTLATSLITDEFMGHYSNKNKNLFLLGYTKVPDDSLYLCGPQDICSIHDDGTFEKRTKMGVHYLPARQMARQTSCIYNEYAMLRTNAKGEEILPTCVISFNTEIDDKTKQFARDNKLPVAVIDWEKYKQIQFQKLKELQDKDNPTPEELENYLYGVVAYYEELLCGDLNKKEFGWSDCLDKIKDKIKSIELKLNINEESVYWPVCEKFKNFHKSTTNDAIGRLFADEIFTGKDNSKEIAMMI